MTCILTLIHVKLLKLRRGMGVFLESEENILRRHDRSEKRAKKWQDRIAPSSDTFRCHLFSSAYAGSLLRGSMVTSPLLPFELVSSVIIIFDT